MLASLQSCRQRLLVSRRWIHASSPLLNDSLTNDPHLGRGLSRPKIDRQQAKVWRRKIKVPKYWDVPPPSSLLNFPQYEFDALTELRKLSYDTNVLLEIRDVRLPASTHHPSFTKVAKRKKKHLICYTHADRIDARTRDRVVEWTNRAWPKASVLFVNAQESQSNVDAFEDMYHWILDASSLSGQQFALTVGVANTGKSSVLASVIRYGRAQGYLHKKKIQVRRHTKRQKKQMNKGQFPEVLDKPGKTRVLTEYLVFDRKLVNPKSPPKRPLPTTSIFMLDVPGMTPPRFLFEERPEVWYGLGACNLLPLAASAQSNPKLLKLFCDFVLYCLNRDGVFEYVHKLQLDKPTQNIDDCLEGFGRKINNDEERLRKQCETFLKLFQTGNFGSVVLDDLTVPFQPFVFRDEHFRKKEEDDHPYKYRKERFE